MELGWSLHLLHRGVLKLIMHRFYLYIFFWFPITPPLRFNFYTSDTNKTHSCSVELVLGTPVQKMKVLARFCGPLFSIGEKWAPPATFSNAFIISNYRILKLFRMKYFYTLIDLIDYFILKLNLSTLHCRCKVKKSP